MDLIVKKKKYSPNKISKILIAERLEPGHIRLLNNAKKSNKGSMKVPRLV